MRLTISYNSNFILEFLHLFLYELVRALLQLTSRLNVDIFRVLLLGQLLHAEYGRVAVQVVEHVRVLVAAQPLVLPVEADGLGPAQHVPQIVFVIQVK